MKERDYQGFAIDSMFHYFESGKPGNPLIAAPTGTGKSVIIGGAIRRLFGSWGGVRVMVLTHVKELVEQNHQKLLNMWPMAPAGIYSAGLNRKESHFPITFAGIASVCDCPELFGMLHMIFIDEAHMVSDSEDAMYNKFIAYHKTKNPALRVVGLTATPFRNGKGLLTETVENKESLFTEICCDMTGMTAFNWFIDQGYLCNLIPMQTGTELDVSKVRTKMGEFDQKQLQEAVDKEEVTFAVVKEAIERAHGRHHWICFAAGVKHTEHVAKAFEYFGISATYVHSKMKEKERDQRIADYKAGVYQVMVNNGILTTGFDFPALDCIIMLRPTKSVGLWIQMLGRGTRPFYADGFDLSTIEGRLDAIRYSQKPNCLVLDFAGNTAKLGPINDPVIPKKKGDKGGVAPIRICDGCGMYNHASATSCFNCGREFPRALAIAPKASTKELVAREETPVVETLKIDKVTYNCHFKPGRPPSIRVTYYCNLRHFEEWVCLEHDGFPAKKARDWWRERSGGEEPPCTTSEGLRLVDSLRTPSHIEVWINKKVPEIMGFKYDPS